MSINAAIYCNGGCGTLTGPDKPYCSAACAPDTAAADDYGQPDPHVYVRVCEDCGGNGFCVCDDEPERIPGLYIGWCCGKPLAECVCQAAQKAVAHA